MNFAYQVRLFKEIFFPRRCTVCKTEIDEGIVCSSCRCHFLLGKINIHGADNSSWNTLMTVGQPMVTEDVFDRVQLLYRYDMAFKDALHSLKFEGKAELLKPLKEEAELALLSQFNYLSKHYDFATCIPTSLERRKQRGFDVPTAIFACLEKSFGDRYTEAILKRVKSTLPLYNMDAENRRTELMGCFSLQENAKVAGKRILLCDDIYTTGSTMLEAGQLLLAAGAKSVGVLAFCASKDNWGC